MNIQEQNLYVMSLLSKFLNNAPDCIDGAAVRELSDVCGLTDEEAYAYLLAAYCGIDIDGDGRELFDEYFIKTVKRINSEDLIHNPYYSNIDLSNIKRAGIEFRHCRYKPFEAFVSDDTIMQPDGRIIPQIGFFDCEQEYPAILENGRIWMTVTPLEINTIQPCIDAAHGKVLAFGLGLGYFAYMAARKKEVKSVTVVERNRSIIELFTEQLLPQFGNISAKLNIVCADAFDYAQSSMGSEGFDFVFTDLWHDVYDGEPMYFKMKEMERYSPNSQFMYWIERSILCHIKGF